MPWSTRILEGEPDSLVAQIRAVSGSRQSRVLSQPPVRQTEACLGSHCGGDRARQDSPETTAASSPLPQALQSGDACGPSQGLLTTVSASRAEEGGGANTLTELCQASSPSLGCGVEAGHHSARLSRCRAAADGLAVGPLATEAGKLVGRESVRRIHPERNRRASENPPEVPLSPHRGPCSVRPWVATWPTEEVSSLRPHAVKKTDKN